jgi:hypothetical protein
MIKILGHKNLRRIISPKSARILALCGDHSNYTFEQAGYNTAGRAIVIDCQNNKYNKNFNDNNTNHFVISICIR